MTPNMLIPAVSLHDRTANLSKLFSEASKTTFNPTNLYDLNDALFNQISLVTPMAIRNSNELYRLKMQAMVVHRLMNGNLMVLVNQDKYWSQRTYPRFEDIGNVNLGPLHDMAENTLMNLICNLGIESTDSPAGFPFQLPYELLRQSVDLTVAGFHIYTKTNETRAIEDTSHVLQIDSVAQVRSPLYAYMVEKGYTWKEVDQKFCTPGTTEVDLGNTDTSSFIQYVVETGFDETVTVNPGLE